ncbi:hypothetical protein GWK47_022010 [Chionoecetes opilio]|uniref:Uncharacterized protein n=1 Tax=Chionoecetes opilio TaxID=41210 RepID=A0A8J5CHK2_CHIOP|nr:hypothetical protein GWK47_022010 [Chionoecetes opilio]
MAATMLTLVCSVCLLLLASGHQDPITEQTPASRQSFHRLVEIMKEKTRREMHWLNNTRKMLLQVSQHIKSPNKFKVEGSTGIEMNACQLDEKDNTTPQVVAATFETFTQRLDPWGTVATLKDTFNQLQCFAKAQIKLSPEKEATEGKESPPRPAVIRYSKVLADRLNTSKFRLSLLEASLIRLHLPKTILARCCPGHMEPETRASRELVNAKIQTSTLVLKKLAVKVETAEVLLAITGAQDGKISMNNLGQMFVNTPPSSSGRLTPIHYGPYCKGIIIRGPVYTIMQRMLTEVSGAALQLEKTKVNIFQEIELLPRCCP